MQSTHILLLEDDTSLAEMLQFVVDELNLQITTVETVDEAREAFVNNSSINLGVIDYNVPGSESAYDDKSHTGYLPELFSSRPNFDYLFITGDTELSLKKAKEYGAIDILRKPFSCEDLQKVIEGILQRKELCESNAL